MIFSNFLLFVLKRLRFFACFVYETKAYDVGYLMLKLWYVSVLKRGSFRGFCEGDSTL